MARELSKKKKEAMKLYIEEMQDDITLKNLQSMKDTMNKAFGEENNQIVQLSEESLREYYEGLGYGRSYIYDIEDSQFIRHLKDSGMGYNIIIRFPEVTITNSKKMSHIMKDLYVKFGIKKDGKFGYDLIGVRTTLTEDEFHSRYMHSHLQSFSPESIRFSHFCTGEGPINQVMSLLRGKFDETNFTLFCLHLKNYVAWESIEGNPFMHIEYIGVPRGSSRRGGLPISTCEKVLDTLKSAIFNPEEGNPIDLLSVSVTPDRVSVVATDEFDIWAAKFMEKVDYKEIDRYNYVSDILCFKDSSGNCVPTSAPRTRGRITHQTTPIFKFKGEDKFLTIIKQDNEIKATKYITPDISQKLCSDLSRGFTKIALEAKGFEEQEDTIECIREVTEPDLFPL